MRFTHHYNWYFGWNIVAVATLLTTLTVGMRMGIGPFFLPLLKDLKFTPSSLSTVIAIGMICYGIAMPLAGYLVNKLGTKFVLLLGTSIILLSSIWTIYATKLIVFTLAFGVTLSIGLAFTSSITFTPIISRWFTRQRGMALFFLSAGSMAGIAIMTPLFNYTIAQLGWRQTLLGYALLFTLIAVPSTLLTINDQAPAHSDLVPPKNATCSASTAIPVPAALQTNYQNLRQVFASLAFWQICLGLFACGFSMNLLGVHGVPMLIDHHFTSTASSFGIGLIGLVAIFSSLMLGRLADKVAKQTLLALIYFVRGIGFFALVTVIAPWQLYLVAIIGGLVWSGSAALSSAILADIYGPKLVGILFGWAFLGHQIGATLSSWLGGWAYEHYHSHWFAFASATILLLLAAVISFFITPPVNHHKPINT